ncbi:hypothetical protein HJFPF1_08916 [Paramyrothecium foliicola]|nr:hypothetical protein HJFPF1_08916 [Paramyrothecium foliicola]
MIPASLGSLPDDLLLDIIQQLHTAHDVAYLGASSKRIHSLTQHAGWKTFIRSRFPSLDTSSGTVQGWDRVANRLTYLDRCWGKRAFFLNIFSEKQPDRPQRRGRPKGQSVPFHPVLDARLLAAAQDELVAWGVGEDLLVWQRLHAGGTPDSWSRVGGHALGYAAGTGDVTAVSVLERDSVPEISVGRANGDVQLLSAAGETCGQVTRSLKSPESDDGEGALAARKSPGQLAVTWTEWQPRTNLLACCRSSVLTLYNLADAEDFVIKPTASVDLADLGARDETSLLRNAKFMGNDLIACALGGSREPLRYYQIIPTGLEPVNGSGILLDGGVKLGTGKEKTTVRAIESVGPALDKHLLLSAWDDGTYRLKDIRTPAESESVYRDRFQPFQGGSSLLVYGTERFVSGSNFGPDLRFFDFRYPKPYHHTDGLPCSGQLPSPDVVRQYDARGLRSKQGSIDECDHLRGIECTWHAQSYRNEWKPDSVLHIGNSHVYDRVYSLTKASDLAGSFYCGLRGAIIEMNLSLAEHVTTKSVQRAAPPGWQVDHSQTKVSFQEPGIGLEFEGGLGGIEESGVPRMWHHKQEVLPEMAPIKTATRRRLDSAYHEITSELPYV